VTAVGAAGSPAEVAVEQDCEVLGAPASVAASNGTFTDRVRVTWAAVTGSTSYYVYRNVANDFSSALLLGSWTGTTADDFSAVIGSSSKANGGSGCNPAIGGGNTIYYYWVTALSSCGQSAPSAPDQGYVGG
jgi:hypothetical protein